MESKKSLTVSLLWSRTITKAPTTPYPAASMGVAQPAYSAPSTTRIRAMDGRILRKFFSLATRGASALTACSVDASAAACGVGPVAVGACTAVCSAGSPVALPPMRERLKRTRTAMLMIRRAESMIPGSRPAISSLTMEVSVMMPNMTKPMLGGIMMPSVRRRHGSHGERFAIASLCHLADGDAAYGSGRCR
jgi:hypothetical protein